MQGGFLTGFFKVATSEVAELIRTVIYPRDDQVYHLDMHPHPLCLVHVSPNDFNIETTILPNHLRIAFDIYTQGIEPSIARRAQGLQRHIAVGHEGVVEAPLLREPKDIQRPLEG